MIRFNSVKNTAKADRQVLSLWECGKIGTLDSYIALCTNNCDFKELKHAKHKEIDIIDIVKYYESLGYRRLVYVEENNKPIQ